ncbi:MAG: hypothetical protein WCC60_03530 [Ilumatobacteraceae bacterium]
MERLAVHASAMSSTFAHNIVRWLQSGDEHIDARGTPISQEDAIRLRSWQSRSNVRFDPPAMPWPRRYDPARAAGDPTGRESDPRPADVFAQRELMAYFVDLWVDGCLDSVAFIEDTAAHLENAEPLVAAARQLRLQQLSDDQRHSFPNPDGLLVTKLAPGEDRYAPFLGWCLSTCAQLEVVAAEGSRLRTAVAASSGAGTRHPRSLVDLV